MNRVLIFSQRAAELGQLLQQRLDVSVDVLTDAARFWPTLARLPYAVLLIDVGKLLALSPVANEPMQSIGAAYPNLSVLLLAASAERRLAVRQMELGAADYLLQPLDPAELVIKVRRGLMGMSSANVQAGLDDFSSPTHQLMMLNEATQEILQTLQLDKAPAVVLSKAKLITAADVAKLWLADRDGNLQGLSSADEQQDVTETEEQFLTTLAHEAARLRKVICRKPNPDEQARQIKIALLLPLFSGDRLVGVLALGRKIEASFAVDQIHWLTVFCRQAAIAIENAQLFHDLSAAYVDVAQNRTEILRSRNTLQTVFDGIHDGVYILDRNLIINVVNQMEADRYGQKSEDLVGQSFLSLAGPANAPTLIDRIRASLANGREYTWIPSEQEQRHSYFENKEFRIYPVHNRLAKTEHVVVLAQDVSERRRWQATLFRSANLAAVGQLAGSVAHQINNPLTVTMTNSQLIMLDAEPGSELQELAASVFKAGQRIQDIVSNLLEFSNQDEYLFTTVDLIDTIEGALALVSRSLMKAQIEVEKNFQVRPSVSASVSHLKLVWVNLLLNARDALVDCEGVRKIVIATHHHSAGQVRITVADNGVGLSEHHLKQAFNPFFTTKPPGKALGLGLYAAQVIIEQHGGHISVTSEPGVLTSFEVVLPVKG